MLLDKPIILCLADDTIAVPKHVAKIADEVLVFTDPDFQAKLSAAVERVLPPVEHVCVMPVRTLNGVEVPPDHGDTFRCSCNQRWIAHDGAWSRRCPNPRCDHGMIGGKTGFSYDYPSQCDDCDGKGWIG